MEDDAELRAVLVQIDVRLLIILTADSGLCEVK